MRNRIQAGSTDWNNTQRLGEGELTFDEEAKALRVHNGSALGGLELPGVRAYEPPAGPGPQELLYGDYQQGFYGELTESEFISTDNLASAIGYTEGNNTDAIYLGWLKFALDEKTLFIAKSSLRYHVSWNAIFAVDAVYDNADTAQVTIGDYQYKVRLLTGADTDPTDVALSQQNPVGVLNSEWNRTLVKLVNDWGGYTSNDLGAGSSSVSRFSFCQEWPTERLQSESRVLRGRGDGGVEWFAGSTSREQAYTTFGWRPVLELIP